MNINKYISSLLCLGLMLTACSEEEVTEVPTAGSGDAVVTVCLTSPCEFGGTKALSSTANSAKGGLFNLDLTDYDLRYQLAVYSVDGELLVSPQTLSSSTGDAASFSLTLSPNSTYQFVAWADFVTAGSLEDLHYNTTDLTNIYSIDSETLLNDESRDAFFVTQTAEVGTSLSLSLTLTRPFAKLRLVTNDYADDDVTEPDAVSVSYYGGTRFTALNALTGAVTGETLADSGNTVYTGSLSGTKEYTAGLDAEEAYRTLAVDYLLAEDSGSTIHLSMTTSSGGSTIATTDVSTDVPLQRNYLTTLTSSFLTGSGDTETDTSGGLDDGSDSESTLWYVTDDSRTFPYSDSYCYGAQNTYYVEQYSSESNSITFEVKARVSDESYATGDSAIVSEPKYYGLVFTSDLDISSVTLLSIPDADDNGYASVSDDYTITVNMAGQSSATYSSTGDASWGEVAIYDASYNLLWTFMICRYLSDDPVSSITYTDIGKSIMDRQLGYGVSIAKAVADSTGQLYGTAYFQYGRPTPFPYAQVTTDLTKAAITSTTTASVALSNPTTFYLTDGTVYNWFYSSVATESLWGGDRVSSPYSGTVTGSKTVYDPCPEGYRVCDDIFFSCLDSATVMYCSNALTTYTWMDSSTITDTSPLSNQNVYKYQYDSSDSSKVDYWTFTGLMGMSNGATASYTDNRYDRLIGAVAYWGSSPQSANYGECFAKVYYTSSSSISSLKNYYKTRGMAVRCQLEE